MRAMSIVFALVGVACATAQRGGGAPGASGRCGLDVLVVIDNASTMAATEANLAANAPAFVTHLDATGRDYRIGVTTAARDYTYTVQTLFGPAMPVQHGDNGALLHPSACATRAAWIDKADPSPAIELACTLGVGTAGPPLPMPLGAIRDALGNSANAGFHRADALLGIVVVTARDDCTYEAPVSIDGSQVVCAPSAPPEPVATYSAFLDANAPRWALAAIGDFGTANCTSALGSAQPAARLLELTDALGPRASATTICADDLGAGLAQAVSTFDAACAE